MTKKYRLSADQMVIGLADTSACFATDRITVDGLPVGFMYRDGDGWNFFAGDESQTYVDNPNNLGVFALNTIANYDRTIVPYLDAPPGSAWVRDGSRFVSDPAGAPVDPDEPAAPSLAPDFPVVEGRYDMTAEWSITVPTPMNRRFEDDALVLWRPGLTAFISVWGNPNLDSPAIRLNQVKNMSSPHRYDDKEWISADLRYFTYRLNERSDDNRQPALYGNVVGIAGHVQVAVYFDRETDFPAATMLISRITANGPQPQTHPSN